MKPLLSIIVPVFNVEKYVKICLDSLISQSLKEIEIIVVNDGSTDGSKEICERVACSDERVKVYTKINGGLSDARNYGLKMASADYVGFVDSDDYVDENFYEELYSALRDFDLDLAVGQIQKKDDFGNTLYTTSCECEGVISNEVAMKSMLSAMGISNSVCNKLFKKTLFSEDPFPIGKLYEDEYVTYKIVDKCEKIYYTNDTAYCYRTNENGITHASFSAKEMDRIEASIARVNYLRDKHPNLVNDGKRYLMYDCLTALSKMEKYESQYHNILISNIRSCLWEYLLGQSSVGAKCFSVIAAISPKCALKLYQLF